MTMDVDTWRALGLDQPTPAQANGRSNRDILAALDHPGDAPYHPCPEAHPSADVPRGTVVKHADWQASTHWPYAVRDLWIHTPAVPAAQVNLIVFNDGGHYLARNGSVRAAAVLDSLQAAGEIPPTLALFVNPGRPQSSPPPFELMPGYDIDATQRSIEYDSLTPDYGRFVLDELLPFVAARTGLVISDDPRRRIACGISSGGIAAFSLGWHFPEAFGCVLSHCGSYTNIRGGHHYPYLVRSRPRKPLRVFLTSGENDGATLFGDWPTANQAMARALDYAGYDHRFEFGSGGHSLRHGGALFADSVRWLWREWDNT